MQDATSSKDLNPPPCPPLDSIAAHEITLAIKALDGKIDNVVLNLHEKMEAIHDSILHKVKRKITEAQREVIIHLPSTDSPRSVHKAMLERVKYLVATRPDKSLNNICNMVIEDYKGVIGTYASVEVLRKSYSRYRHTL